MASQRPRTEWLDSFRRVRKPRFRLFALPYAGGGTHVFQGWPEKLPDSIDFCPIHLPGRGKRFRENLSPVLADLVGNIASGITPFLDLPFGFFGHSMGAMLAYETALHLRENRGLQPAILFVSGRRAPHVPLNIPPIHHLPVAEFTSELRNMNGAPPEVFANHDLMELMLPILRADFALSEDYQYVKRDPLDCAIIALGGLGDPHISKDHIAAWKDHTKGRFSSSMLPGGHFFIHSAQSHVISIVNKELSRVSQEKV